MGIGLSGITSGLDTDSIISAMVMEKTSKRDKLQQSQTKLQWTQDAWKSLNTKVYSFYTKTLSNMRLAGSYNKKKTSVSDSSVATVTAKSGSVDGSQTLGVKQLAKAGYLTGAAMTKKTNLTANAGTRLDNLGITASGVVTIGSSNIGVSSNKTFSELKAEFASAGWDADRLLAAAAQGKTLGDIGLASDTSITINGTSYALNRSMSVSDLKTELENGGVNMDFVNHSMIVEEPGDVTTSTTMSELGITGNASITLNGTAINLTGDMTVGDLVTAMKNAGVNANFDTTNQRFFVSSKSSGKNNDFAFGGNTDALQALGLYVADGETSQSYGTNNQATRVYGQDAEIYLNGAYFKSSSNTFNINGLSITAQEVTGYDNDGNLNTVSITTSTDTDAVYNMVKDFIKGYNELINEMDKLYNADSSKGYDPLTDEQKEAMTDKEIENWETKIKDSLLRRDSTLNSVIQTMKTSMAGKGANGGYLSDYGITTAGYFYSADNERGAYHILGDSDDSYGSSYADKLLAALNEDPDAVAKTISGVAQNLYSNLTTAMRSTTMSSAFTLYNDKQMKEEYTNYTSKIAEQEEKISWWEDYYRSKFTYMEKMLSSLNQQQSSLAGLLGS